MLVRPHEEYLDGGKLFQPSLMFVGKTRVYPSEVPLWDRLLTLPTNIKTGLEKLAKDKHSSLLQKFVTYGRKKFHNIGHRLVKLAREKQ